MSFDPEKPVEDLGVPSNPKVKPTTTLGTGGTAFSGGYVVEFEKDARITGSSKYRTYSNILANTNIVAAGTRFFLNLVGKANWKIEPANKSPEAKRLASLVNEMLHDMITPLHRVVRRAAMFRFYGFSVQEIIAKKRDDGHIGIRDISPRPQATIERWNVSETGDVLGVFQRNPQNHFEHYIPRKKLLYVVDDSMNDSPEGLGIFRQIVDAAGRLSRLEQLEGFGFDSDLRGVPVGRGPFGRLQELVQSGQLTPQQKAELEEPMKRFMRSHIRNPQIGMLLDSQTWTTSDEKESPSSVYQWDLELLKGDGSGLEEIARAITRIQNEIARVLGVDHLMIGSDGAGSLALSRDKSTNFGLIVDSVLREIAAAFRNDVIRKIFELNGWETSLIPNIKTDVIAYRDVEQMGKIIGEMARAGVVLDRSDEGVGEIFDLLGLTRLPGDIPEPTEEEEAE